MTLQNFKTTRRWRRLTSLMLIIILQAMAVPTVLCAQNAFTLDLWPSGAPVKSSDAQDTARVYVYLPEEKLATGQAVVICPGGGYGFLAMDHEGHGWAPFLNGQGVAVIVLKYRMPHGNPAVPVGDAEEAMRLVRRNATAWHVDKNKVGIMGFSAGGHLASVIATRSKGEAAPNFQMLFYPVITMDPDFGHAGSHNNLLGSRPGKRLQREYSTDLQVTRATPRALIVLSDDDHDVLPANGTNYYLECYRHDVPASLHVYPTGGHGWGIRQSFPYHFELMLELKAWLRQ